MAGLIETLTSASNQLNTDIANCKIALESKGVEVGSITKLSQVPDAILSIEGGSVSYNYMFDFSVYDQLNLSDFYKSSK